MATEVEISQREATSFWRRMDISGGDSACWRWKWTPQRKRKVTTKGGKPSVVPRITWRGKCMNAHTFGWALRFGYPPKGLFVRRLCGTTDCCNPAHMELSNTRSGRLNMQQRKVLKRLYQTSDVSIQQLADRYGLTWEQANLAVQKG